jgi:hypothetical protein
MFRGCDMAKPFPSIPNGHPATERNPSLRAVTDLPGKMVSHRWPDARERLSDRIRDYSHPSGAVQVVRVGLL